MAPVTFVLSDIPSIGPTLGEVIEGYSCTDGEDSRPLSPRRMNCTSQEAIRREHP